MKLTYEDKIQIYQLRKQSFSLKNLSKIYNATVRNLDYLVQFIDRYGIESVKKGGKRAKNSGARIKKRRLKSSQKNSNFLESLHKVSFSINIFSFYLNFFSYF